MKRRYRLAIRQLQYQAAMAGKEWRHSLNVITDQMPDYEAVREAFRREQMRIQAQMVVAAPSKMYDAEDERFYR